ncbi:bifunctional glutamate N-acetyltransferase/amino-acid acetyltransferase ArgJ [Lentilactobacillus buchneri]|uniref:Arginine biosynthesis bifunctional protein ArgJ n=1 Tax=Lentilactobacillus buchneri DSM 20057 TaxID=1423728 RepID=A0A4R5NSS1_LENBU|nr:bifunctional glutamate N-acetyltransferase/amino-acid acetyltransferase ArgJ [Lentilactobacillus buchneri]KRK68876.1 arginine biosynthesis bifunctional protein ArgJ [Lentilactobacillus buchneri DSM 20057]MCT3252390.1 bifunctional glutamate N-acetyltransferase/amino-acid acetyltransferase ArgJ [Lentilactobacillus buchneri]MCT3546979.1 bifunctional glutamate N-acetyltransferase/amino-acid acetyltransferase ArgJ [Lentilactobacillus buchneri]MCT4438374.1 bifunctional glutamate N-acetyltransferas
MQMTSKTLIEVSQFTWPKGFSADSTHAGFKPDQDDMGWLYSSTPANAAGVYTTNQFQAAPTKLTKQTINLAHQLQAVVMNSGNANSCNGAQGETDALMMQKMTADRLQIDPQLVGIASTGVIGEPLPMDKIKAGISQLKLTQNVGVTKAILTTDTHPKTMTVKCLIDGQEVTTTGFCKGSGMIHPNMATMLGFVTTDAAIAGGDLQQLLSTTVDETFNQITVDGDTSTNDMVVVMANGAAENQPLTKADPDYPTFAAAFKQVLTHLAQEIAGDGEGASKLVEVNVSGAYNHLEGQRVAKAIVGSNLVKAMIFGEDGNWGRIMQAIGQTTAHVDLNGVSVAINDLQLVHNCLGTGIDDDKVAATLKQNKVVIDVDLHAGKATGTAWGCDLTYQYVQINASYRS